MSQLHLVIAATAMLRGPLPVSVVKPQVQWRGALLRAELHRGGGTEPLRLSRAVWPRAAPPQMLAKKQGKKKTSAARRTANPPSAPRAASSQLPTATAVPVPPPQAVPVVAATPVAAAPAPGVPMATAVPVSPGSAGADPVQAVPVLPSPPPIVPTEDAADAEVAAAMGEVPAVGTPAGAGAVRVGEDARAEEGDDGEEEGEDDDLGLELLDLVDEIGSRGANAAPDDVSDVLEIATDLAAADPAGMNWDLSPHLAGAWRLRFTNSKAFHLNGGLTGYAKEVAGVTTPELIMKVQTNYRLLTFEEPLEFQQRSLASLMGNLARANSISAECSWSVGSAGQMLIAAKRLVAADRIWEPADKQAKALRVLGACTPAYLDEDLLVLWGQVEGVLFVFEKV